jgi:hypothetical protein
MVNYENLFAVRRRNPRGGMKKMAGAAGAAYLSCESASSFANGASW